MFDYINGTVTEIQAGLIILECNGIGYACCTSKNTTSAIQEQQQIRLYTYLNVRDGGMDLFGFATAEERSCFKLLINVSGVGPKAALAILSVAPLSTLALAVITGDEQLLTQAQGIGKKTAQRIILELRDKMAKEQLENGTKAKLQPEASVNHAQEAISALMVLGYSQIEALDAMAGVAVDTMDTEEIIRHCLKKLAIR